MAMTTNSGSHLRTIIHFDIDCFYAQVEMIRDPSLRGKPLGIQQKYLLVTCNYDARRRGVTKLMSITEAQKKCPDLMIVNGEDLTHYRNMSYRISDYIQKYTQQVERLGFDENYADVSDMVEDRLSKGNYQHTFCGKVYKFEDDSKDTVAVTDSIDDTSVCPCGCMLRIQIGSQIAADIREGLNHELGITSCAGIAHNKLLAKLVGSIHKPNQQTSVLPHLGCQLVSSLPGIRSIPGIGSNSAKRLKAHGIDSIWDLRQAALPLLKEEFGKNVADTFSKLCLGIDDSSVVEFTLPQTISDEDSFKCCSNLEDAKRRIQQLIVSLLKRLKEDGRTPSTLRLTVRGKDYIKNSRQCPIPTNVFKGLGKASENLDVISSRLISLLINLFQKLVDVSQPFHLTLINVCFAKLQESSSSQNTLDSFFMAGNSNKSSSKQNSSHEHTAKGACDVDEFEKLSEKESHNEENGKYFDVCRDEARNFGQQNVNAMVQTAESNKIGTESFLSDTCFSISNVVTMEQFPKTNVNGILDDVTETPFEEERQICNTSKKPESFSVAEPTDPCFQSEIGNNQLSSENLKKLLPKHINASEVLALPDDIQNEVLSSFGITSEISRNGHRTYALIHKVKTRSQRQQHISCNADSILNEGNDLLHNRTQRKPLFSPRKRKSESYRSEMSSISITSISKIENTNTLKIRDTSDTVQKRQKFNNDNDDVSMNNEGSDNKKISPGVEQSRNLAVSCDAVVPPLSLSSNSSSSNALDSTATTLNTNKTLALASPFVKAMNEKADQCFELDPNVDGMRSPSPQDNVDPIVSKDMVCQVTSPVSKSSKQNTQRPYSVQNAGLDKSSVSINTKKKDTNELHSDPPQDNIDTEAQNLLNAGPGTSSGQSLALSPSVPNKHSSKSPYPKGRNCPVGIDPDVFYSLPSNIQGEILAHNAMGTGSLFTERDHPEKSKDNSASCSNFMTNATSSRYSVAGQSNSSRKGGRAQRAIFDYFKKK